MQKETKIIVRHFLRWSSA